MFTSSLQMLPIFLLFIGVVWLGWRTRIFPTLWTTMVGVDDDTGHAYDLRPRQLVRMISKEIVTRRKPYMPGGTQIPETRVWLRLPDAIAIIFQDPQESKRLMAMVVADVEKELRWRALFSARPIQAKGLISLGGIFSSEFPEVVCTDPQRGCPFAEGYSEERHATRVEPTDVLPDVRSAASGVRDDGPAARDAEMRISDVQRERDARVRAETEPTQPATEPAPHHGGFSARQHRLAAEVTTAAGRGECAATPAPAPTQRLTMHQLGGGQRKEMSVPITPGRPVTIGRDLSSHVKLVDFRAISRRACEIHVVSDNEVRIVDRSSHGILVGAGRGRIDGETVVQLPTAIECVGTAGLQIRLIALS